MPNNRATIKAYLKQVIESIETDLGSLSVVDNYVNAGATDPYVFINSANTTPNLGEGTVWDNATYERGYEFQINFVFAIDENAADPYQEARVDEIEQLVLDKLQSQEVRDNHGNPDWLDLIVTDVSAPYSPEIEELDNCFYKTFTVQIRYLHPYV